jgi:phage tail sheath protein FI
MPAALSYPGVYVEEIPSGVRTIVSVPTSVTAFVGRTSKGPVDEATDITSWTDFERKFGGLWQDSQLPFAVRDFYQNGGSRAVIVRLFQSEFSSDPELASAEQESAEEAIAALKSEMTKGGVDTGKKVKDAFNKKLGSEDGNTAGSIWKAVKDAEEALSEANDDNEKKAAQKKLDLKKAALRAAESAAIIINHLENEAKDENGKTPLADSIALAEKSGLAKEKRELSVGDLKFEAISAGKWAGYLRLIAIPRDSNAFDLQITDLSPGGTSESFINLTIADGPRRVDKVLEKESNLLRWKEGEPIPKALPDFKANGIGEAKALGDSDIGTAYLNLLEARKNNPNPKEPSRIAAEDAYKKAIDLASASVSDGQELTASNFFGTDQNPGIRALDQLYTRDGLFNLLCIPPYNTKVEDKPYVDVGVIAAAASYCEERRAMLIVDPPKDWDSIDKANKGFSDPNDQIGTRSENAAIFFPRIKQPNPFRDNQIEEFAPCGVVAGIFARTDTERGVWKAPAGIEASLKGVNSLTTPMTDLENGLLNPLGINCLRHFPVYGKVVWGSRTLKGADGFASEWKYIPVRRTALFIEESLFRGTKWVVFEPNDEPLWAQIRLSVGAFMHNLFRQGAFQGSSPREAYFVKCDSETTTQNDINLGVVNIHVGFKPLKPAEFVVIKLQQMAGQIEV